MIEILHNVNRPVTLVEAFKNRSTGSSPSKDVAPRVSHSHGTAILLYGERGTKKRRTEKRTGVQQRRAWARPENGMEASHGTVHSRESVKTPSGLKTSGKIPGRFCITKTSRIFPPKCWTFFDQKGNRQMIAKKIANWYNPTYDKSGQKTSGDCKARPQDTRV
jgi:hypothetical protein